jgi:hypothetical protein
MKHFGLLRGRVSSCLPLAIVVALGASCGGADDGVSANNTSSTTVEGTDTVDEQQQSERISEGVLQFGWDEFPRYDSAEALVAASPVVVTAVAGATKVLGSSRVDGADDYRALLVQEYEISEVLRDTVTQEARRRALDSRSIDVLWNGPNPDYSALRTELVEGDVVLDPLGTGVVPPGQEAVLFLEPSVDMTFEHLSEPVLDAFMVVGRWQGIALTNADDRLQPLTGPLLGALPGLSLTPDQAERLREKAPHDVATPGIASLSLPQLRTLVERVPYIPPTTASAEG